MADGWSHGATRAAERRFRDYLQHNRYQPTGYIGNYFTDVLNIGFGQWIGANYPDDSDLMYDPESGNNIFPPFITPESVALWEQHVPEFIESLEG